MRVLDEDNKIKISIHTPAKGVTMVINMAENTEDISIHTPAKGVTILKLSTGTIYRNFNPHSREGSDGGGVYTFGEIAISIHTPAKGVTKRQGAGVFICKISIHTPAKGVTEVALTVFIKNNYFNPHSREGSDCKNSYTLIKLYAIFCTK